MCMGNDDFANTAFSDPNVRNAKAITVIFPLDEKAVHQVKVSVLLGLPQDVTKVCVFLVVATDQFRYMVAISISHQHVQDRILYVWQTVRSRGVRARCLR